MTSQCHNTEVGVGAVGALNRDIPQQILDATRASMLAVGVRRTTLTDVARRAGISRMTVYRRYPDVSALFSDLMVREFGGVLAAATRAGASCRTARTRLVAEAVAGVKAVQENPLFAKVLDLEP